ncbi:hypothetical protein [Candidatus Ruthturnera calyptogenae]|uniref:AAA family ATPase n=1 Tax=Candidatus Ruthturnera calyptogenae TaxID=386487 RepID=UPI0030F3B8F9
MLVQKYLCNTPTQLMNELSYGKEYRYAHDESDAFARGKTYFPNEFGGQVYQPSNRGLEIKIGEKLKQLRGL